MQHYLDVGFPLTSLTTAERVTLNIRCLNCVKSTQKSLAWLMRKKEMTCAKERDDVRILR